MPTLQPPTRARVQFGGPSAKPMPVVAPAPAPKAVENPPKAKKQKVKNDPLLVAKARELRNRWLEQVNAPGGASLLTASAKYEVSRQIAEARLRVDGEVQQVAALPALPALPVLPAAVAA